MLIIQSYPRFVINETIQVYKRHVSKIFSAFDAIYNTDTLVYIPGLPQIFLNVNIQQYLRIILHEFVIVFLLGFV